MYDHIAFTLDCAERLRDIGHTPKKPKHHVISGVGSMDELLQNLGKTGDGYQLLVSDNLDGKIGYTSDVPTDRQMCQFYIVKQCNATDYQQRAATKKDCKAVASKIIARILYLIYQANTGMSDEYGVKNIDAHSFSYQTVGPLADFYFGIEISFDIFNQIDLVMKQSDWDV